MRFGPKRRRTISTVRRRRSGLCSLASGFPQDLIVQRLVRHQTLQPRVLFLQLLQLTRHLRAHPPVVSSPTIVRLFADPQLLTNLGDLLSIPQAYIRLPQQTDDLFGTMSLLHGESFPAHSAGWILSYFLEQFSGWGSIICERVLHTPIPTTQSAVNPLYERYRTHS